MVFVLAEQAQDTPPPRPPAADAAPFARSSGRNSRARLAFIAQQVRPVGWPSIFGRRKNHNRARGLSVCVCVCACERERRRARLGRSNWALRRRPAGRLFVWPSARKRKKTAAGQKGAIFRHSSGASIELQVDYFLAASLAIWRSDALIVPLRIALCQLVRLWAPRSGWRNWPADGRNRRTCTSTRAT